MAERRMFARSIIDSDLFLDMPVTAQLLYFHLSMRADDDGFVDKPKSIMRMCSCTEDDLQSLIERQFVFWFDTGVVVIRHWRIHNYIRKDTYKATMYTNEFEALSVDEFGAYVKGSQLPVTDSSRTCHGPVTDCIQSVEGTLTQDRIGKDRIGKDRDNSTTQRQKREKPSVQKHRYGEYKNVLLSDAEMEKLKQEFPQDWKERVDRLSFHMESKGVKYKNHLATIRNWARRDREQAKKTGPERLDYSNYEKGVDSL